MREPQFDGRPTRILDFDVECRPLAWYGGDFVTKQPTAIAWRWVGERGRTRVAVIGASHDTRQTKAEERAMLEAFLEDYARADVVTGHFIRGFDLPLLNGACIKRGLPMLPEKLSQDTKLDFARRHGLSMSQENLGALFELEHPKIPMNTPLWEEGNMLTPAGIRATRKRVVGDVEQHVELRQTLLERGILGRPRLWTPETSGQGSYHA